MYIYISLFYYSLFSTSKPNKNVKIALGIHKNKAISLMAEPITP